MIHPCPPSSYTLSLVTLLLIKKNVRARQGSRKAVSPLCPVRGHPDRAGYSSSLLALVDLHFAALLSQDGPLPTNCYSPSPGERKGRLLVTQRDKGGTGWLDTRTIFFLIPPIMTLLERRLTNVECCVFKFKQVDVGNIPFRFVVESLMKR